MKLNDILSENFQAAEWEAKGYQLPHYDIAAVAKKTHDEPTWVHFGAGNIFRAFPAAILNDALNTGKYDRGVIVAESFDYEIIDKAYRPYHNLSLLVSLQSNGTIEKKVIASITESLKADKQFGEDWARLVQIFQAPSLQMVTFTITEKGYSFNDADLAHGLDAVFAMGKLTALLYERFKAGKLPVTLQSTDNCSHNGDHVKAGVKAYAEPVIIHFLLGEAIQQAVRIEDIRRWPSEVITIIMVFQLLDGLLPAQFQMLGKSIDIIAHLGQQFLLGDAADAGVWLVHTDIRDVIELAEDAELRELRDARQEDETE
jgi:hypothetical protein